MVEEKKRLLLATDNYLPRWDGIARFLSEIMPYLKDYFEITVIAPTFPKFENRSDEKTYFRIVRIKPSKFTTFGDYVPARLSYKQIKEEVKKHDIVWVQASGPIGISAIIASKKLKKPCILFAHSLEWDLAKKSLSKFNPLRFIVGMFGRMWVRYAYNRCSLIMVPSAEVREILMWHGINARMRVVPIGIRTDKFRPPKDRESAKEKIGIGPTSTVVGYCGRIGREKDLVTLYKAFQRLAERQENVKLLVVGEGVTDHDRVNIPKDKVIEVGAKDDVIPYLQAMDIYVLPSLTETSSLSTMEAMSTECAVVATPVGQVASYIKNKVNGIFFPKRNYTVLYLKLKWLCENETARHVYGQMARQTIVKEYNWEYTPKKIVDTLKEFSH